GSPTCCDAPSFAEVPRTGNTRLQPSVTCRLSHVHVSAHSCSAFRGAPPKYSKQSALTVTTRAPWIQPSTLMLPFRPLVAATLLCRTLMPTLNARSPNARDTASSPM
ncbi:unnamed protein product, partial [Ectocarpus sp. 8 AP-2014]